MTEYRAQYSQAEKLWKEERDRLEAADREWAALTSQYTKYSMDMSVFDTNAKTAPTYDRRRHWQAQWEYAKSDRDKIQRRIDMVRAGRTRVKMEMDYPRGVMDELRRQVINAEYPYRTSYQTRETRPDDARGGASLPPVYRTRIVTPSAAPRPPFDTLVKQWYEQTVQAFKDYSTLIQFPVPPYERACTNVTCKSNPGNMAPVCKCTIRKAFQIAERQQTAQGVKDFLKKEQRRWHSDRFSGCKDADTMKAKANEIFVVVNAMYDEKK